MELTHFSLFTGIGGIDLAAEWAGFETVGQCEFADFPTKVLEKNFPDVERWRDVRDVTVESIRGKGITEVTLLSGGFPCQPHSLAGKRRASSDERDLWPEYKRIISEVRPKWVLGENVPGILSSEDGRFFRGILRDLSEMGYSVGWGTYGANVVGAVHRRERVFLIAYSSSFRCMDEQIKKHSTEKRQQALSKFTASFNDVTYSNNKHEEWSSKKKISWIETLQGEYDPRSIEDWRERSTIYQPKLCRSHNGIPNQMDRNKCLGNAVVPQQVYPILKMIADIERQVI